MKLISFAVLLHACICYGAIQSLVEQKQEEFDSIGKYELIYLNLDQFESSNIIELDAYGQHYKVQLTRNHQIAPNVNHQTENGLIKREPAQSCHYHGKVLNYDGKSVVAISLCDKYGVRGMIRAFDDELWIQPADYYLDIENTRKTFKFTDQHLVYKLSDYNMSEKEKAFGLNFISTKESIGNTHEQLSDRRRLASFNSGDNVVEIYILADKSFVDYFKGAAEDWYSLLYYTLSTILNGASAEYQGTNWNSVVSSGGKEIGEISLAWVALDVVEAYGVTFADMYCPNPCSYGGKTGSSAMLRKFGDWAQANKDLSDFDYGMVYTADDYFGSGGLSWVGGVCNDVYKYGWIGETSMSRGYQLVFAHELGHNFGMQHDNKDGEDYYCGSAGIMRTPTVNDEGFTVCSLQYLRDYFNSNGVTCLVRRTNAFESNIDQEAVDPWACVLISGATQNSQHNGEWSQVGYDGNNERFYQKDGYYLYLAKSSTDDWSMWSISQDYSAAYTWSNLVCNWRPADIFEDCDGRWPSDDSAQFDYCPVDTTPQSSPTPQPTTPTPQPTTPTPQPTLPPVDTPTEPPSPTPQPTDAPIPTPQPTDPPVDSPAGDCITISGFTQSGWTQQNGIWYEGSTHNGYPSYSKDGWYLYMNPYTFSDGSTYYFWVFSQTLGLNTFNYGYCRRVDGPVTQCGGYYSVDPNAQFEACGALTSLAESHPCLVDNPYDDNLCFYQNTSMESQEPLNFAVTTDINCINDYGVYRYTGTNDNGTNSTYYLHRTNSQWIISIDFISQYGAYFCDETDLLDCENGKWRYEVNDGDSAKIESNDDIMISSCDTESAVEENNKSYSTIISIVLVAVVLVVCGFCVFLFIRSNRNKGIQSFETNANQIEPRNVGVSMDATAPQTEDVQEIEVEVPATHTVE
eukprot:CAMPEP_0201567526 /NCGR_PEP_ID=MMETSP0190_2-20130828/8030_1 /ASSEMBLY_ACC=CAM_ASM_000263 /TAXON_ID=37353 /ORGANISM="Rosalina sp." /LENGTH=910 /DNA_ID=CAMNT_0047987601 /DNA_START=76 /DNA_END=2808 /DNA_ORIENTATION=+